MIEITTTLTEQAYLRFYAFTMFRSRNPRFRRFVFLGVLPAVSLGMILLNLLRPGIVIGYILGGLGLVMFGAFLYMLGPGARKQYQLLPGQLKVPQHLAFGEESIEASCVYEGETLQTRYPYDQMAAQETSDALYIFVAANQAILLPKGDVGGKLDSLKQLLHERLTEQRYMLCDKPSRNAGKKEKYHEKV